MSALSRNLRNQYSRRKARLERQQADKPNSSWLLTFGDLITLLLALFVMVFSMSSIDSSNLERISESFQPDEAKTDTITSSGRERARQILEILQADQEEFGRDDKIKNLLFPAEIIPVQLERGGIQDDVQIVKREDGIALVLTDKLLFAAGTSSIPEGGRQVLQAIQPLLVESGANIAITGHTDSVAGTKTAPQGGANAGRNTSGVDAYALSANRAIAVLRFYIDQGLAPYRFTVAGYGADRPLLQKGDEKARAKNRRVEILIKTKGMYSK